MSAGGQHPLLARHGTFFLAAGFAARFLMLDDVHPVAEAAGIGMLLLGSGLLLLELALRGGAAGPAPVLLLPLLLVWAARSGEPASIKRAIDFWAACAAGLAIRELVRDRGRAALVRPALAAAAIALGLFALAQRLFLRAEVLKVAEELAHELTHTDLGRAFLASWRSAATCISPNAFAGLLLLAGLPLAFAAGRALASAAPAAVRLGAAAALLVVVAGFGCAASAGAAFALVAGCLLLGWLGTRGRARAWSGAALAALAAVAVVLVSVAASGSGLTGKLRTLQERIDYHKAGLRLLAASFPGGTGLELAGRKMMGVTRPNEAFSRSIHDWWLQGLVEGGIAWLAVAAALVWALTLGVRRGLGAKPAAADVVAERDPRARLWWWGLGAGTLLSLILEPMVSVLPYGLAPAPLRALATALVFAAGAVIARRLPLGGPAYALGLAAGTLAFAIHGLVDFDLWIPNVMLAFATALALLLAWGDRVADAARRTSPLARGLTAAWGIVSLLMPCAVVLLAQAREHVH